MKKLLCALVVICMSFTASAVDFTSKFSTGTKSVKTTGEVKITGTASEYSNVNIKGIKSDYDININPCSGCGTGDTGDYKVIGDYSSWSNSTTALDITQKIDNTATGAICDVSVELGALKTGYSTETLTETNITTMDNHSITNVTGGDSYKGEIFKSGNLVGSINEGSEYNQTIKTDLTTITTEKVRTYSVKSYIGG